MPLSQAELNIVRALVRERSAIVLDEDKGYLVESRLLPLAQQEGLESVSSLVARLGRASTGLERQVVEAMATNETYFFRDVRPFDVLRQQVLPELVQRRAGERALRIWSAACSSGQEPHSIAMLLRAHQVVPLGWQVRLLGTDLSTGMLGRARQGRYSQMEINRGLPAALLVKYFERAGLEWQLKDEVRRMVEFSALNLIEDWPALPPLDVVFLRNVLIYFDVPTKKQVLANLRRVLRPDGYLFLGGAETTLNLDENYERAPFEGVSCFRLRRAPGDQPCR
jgi:chemotaxis protein methyltransferase CheR